jgi:hypothetical protein
VHAQVVNPANGHTYYLTEGGLTFFEVRDLATLIDGHLVVIEDAEEQAWIEENLVAPTSTGSFWIGLTDELTEGTYQWETGDPLGYMHWAPGQPVNSEAVDHVVMWSDGEWVTREATTPNIGAIIEVPGIPLPSVGELRCRSVGTDMGLLWSNEGMYDAVEVHRDGVLLATLPGDATEYLDVNPGPPNFVFEYQVIPTTGSQTAFPRLCRSNYSDPSYTYRVSSVSAPPGATVETRVYLDTGDDLQGWSLGVCHDPQELELLAFDEGLTTATANCGDPPDFVGYNWGLAGWGVGVVLN